MNRLTRGQGRNKKVSGNKWKWTHYSPKPMGHCKIRTESNVHSNTALCKKERNISNKQPNPTTIRTGGITTNKAQRE